MLCFRDTYSIVHTVSAKYIHMNGALGAKHQAAPPGSRGEMLLLQRVSAETVGEKA